MLAVYGVRCPMIFVLAFIATLAAVTKDPGPRRSNRKGPSLKKRLDENSTAASKAVLSAASRIAPT